MWAIRALSARQHTAEPVIDAPAEPDDPWIARQGASIAGTHVWAGQTAGGMLRTPADCAAIAVGPPRAGKTRKVIAPTLACWDGPRFVTSTKGDILQSAAHRAGRGPVAVYDLTARSSRSPNVAPCADNAPVTRSRHPLSSARCTPPGVPI